MFVKENTDRQKKLGCISFFKMRVGLFQLKIVLVAVLYLFKYMYFLNIYPLSANTTKWSNTPKQFVGKLPTNCLSVFDQFCEIGAKRANKEDLRGMVEKWDPVLEPPGTHETLWEPKIPSSLWARIGPPEPLGTPRIFPRNVILKRISWEE